MQIDPVAEWQRLTEFYRAKGDEELLELAEDFGNLTETAQDVLKTELRSRGLSMPGSNQQQAASEWRPSPYTGFQSSVDPDEYFSRDEVNDEKIDASDVSTDEDVPVDYTWKTVLCECETTEEAYQIREMLHRAQIDAWVQRPGTRWSIFTPRVMVAADQLEAAQAVAAQPIPKGIADELKIEVPDFVPPTCPKCHAEDPVLESADPSNNWLCEACGARWSDPLPDSGTNPS